MLRCVHLDPVEQVVLSQSPCKGGPVHFCNKLNKNVSLLKCKKYHSCLGEFDKSGICEEYVPTTDQINLPGEIKAEIAAYYRKSIVSRDEKVNFSGKTSNVCNCGVADFGGKRWLFFRTWTAKTNKTHIAELDGIAVVPGTISTLHFPYFTGEDARPFHYQGQLWTSFTAYNPKTNIASVGYGRLEFRNNRWRLADIFQPEFSGRNRWEKNWVFFESQGDLFCVYKSTPTHHVFQVFGNQIVAEFDTPAKVVWHGRGEVRGGASPVLHNGEFYHFFHTQGPGVGYEAVYKMGVYKFEAKPPFRITGWVPHPILDRERVRPGYHLAVVYPCGAVFDNGNWVVGFGENDNDCRIAVIPHENIKFITTEL